ncbi:MAG TPA: hypothetical protein VKE96_31740 [Vicinamibacterales bacterium]|nr:hypothetical protein [Vicinamibacterales bacterium]
MHDQTIRAIALFDPADTLKRVQQSKHERLRQACPLYDCSQRQRVVLCPKRPQHATTPDHGRNEVRIPLLLDDSHGASGY